MAYYDQLAFSGRPRLYLASPSTSDQSVGSIIISSNSLSLTGQPIIYGHASSFQVDASHSAVLDGNNIFLTEVTTEFVLYANKPTDEVDIISADNGSGVFLSQNGIILRIVSIKNGSTIVQVGEVRVAEWHEKMYISVHIGSNQATLSVNGHTSDILIDGDLDLSTTAETIGANFTAGYYFLLDGLGIYGTSFVNKGFTLDDPGSGHTRYATGVYKGQTTKFETYEGRPSVIVPLSSFYYDPDQEAHLYSYPIPFLDSVSYFIVRSNDDNLPIDYDLNGLDPITFYDKVVISFSNPGVISFRVFGEVSNSFVLSIELISNPSILTQTPAFLNATGSPLFPREFSEEIVNCPEGTILDGSSYEGTWTGNEFIEDPPQSIEIVFKPKDSTQDVVIFSSVDGTVSTGTQTGYTMYLNGTSVADLTGVKWGQWNHLVLTFASATATSFYLNTDGSSTSLAIDYLYLSSYWSVLSSSDSNFLYQLVSGIDSVSVDETDITVSEGSFDSGSAFATYNNSWSIVGAGGS